MRFKEGQKVVCVFHGPWELGFGPSFNDIVTVEGYKCSSVDLDGIRLTNRHWLKFIEWKECSKTGHRIGYAAKHFRPLVDITEITETLEQQPEHA